MTKEIAHIVVIDPGFKAQLSLVVKQHRGCLQLNIVALLFSEVENRQ